MERSPFEISGYGGAPLPCLLHASGGEERVAVVFPGAAGSGYRLGGIPARPDLHYTRALLLTEGVAVFEVWWDADTAPRDDFDGWVAANADAALAAAADGHHVGAIVGRSIGSIALAHLVTQEDWEARGVPTIWIAPLLHLPNVARALEGLTTPAFVLGGTADRAFDADVVDRVRDRAEVVELEGAHHGLEVEDPVESARLLADALERLRAFVRAATSR